MILMPQIFDVTANENERYKRNELELGFKHCTVHRYSIATMLHVTAEPRGRQDASSMYFY